MPFQNAEQMVADHEKQFGDIHDQFEPSQPKREHKIDAMKQN